MRDIWYIRYVRCICSEPEQESAGFLSVRRSDGNSDSSIEPDHPTELGNQSQFSVNLFGIRINELWQQYWELGFILSLNLLTKHIYHLKTCSSQTGSSRHLHLVSCIISGILPILHVISKPFVYWGEVCCLMTSHMTYTVSLVKFKQNNKWNLLKKKITHHDLV